MLLLVLALSAQAGQHLDTTQVIAAPLQHTMQLELYEPSIEPDAPKPYQRLEYSLEQSSPGIGVLQVQKSCFYLQNRAVGWCTDDSLEELAAYPDGLLTKALVGHPLSVRLDDTGKITRVERFEPAFETLAGWGLVLPAEARPQMAEAWQQALSMMHNLCASAGQLDGELEEGTVHETTTSFAFPGRRPFEAVMMRSLDHQVDELYWVEHQAWIAPVTADAGAMGDGRMGVDVRDGRVHRLLLTLRLREPSQIAKLECETAPYIQD
jgi:hypothetical protein